MMRITTDLPVIAPFLSLRAAFRRSNLRRLMMYSLQGQLTRLISSDCRGRSRKSTCCSLAMTKSHVSLRPFCHCEPQQVGRSNLSWLTFSAFQG